MSIYFSVKQHCTLMVSVLPNMSSDTGVLRISPVNSHNVCLASIPEVPSNTYNIQVKWFKITVFKNSFIRYSYIVDT